MKRHDAPTATMLRLVNTHDEPGRRVRRAHNAAAAGTRGTKYRTLSGPAGDVSPAQPVAASDPRWVFAARVASQIEGGCAGVLRPERRERLMKTAKFLDLRPFDATLIIAMVQDGARRGEMPPGYPALTPSLTARLEAVPRPERKIGPPVWLNRLSAACLIATGLVAVGILWVQGAGG